MKKLMLGLLMCFGFSSFLAAQYSALQGSNNAYGSGATPAAISGNAATATALAATPSACSLPQVALGIAASGNASCSEPSNITGNSATVTTNANLTGDVTSSGNATTAAATQANIATLSHNGISVSGVNGLSVAGPINLVNSYTGTGNGALTYDQTNTEADFGNGTSTQAIHLGAWVSWTPSFTGFSANPTVSYSKYAKIGRTITAILYDTPYGTSNATTYTVTLPVASAGTVVLTGGDATNNAVASVNPCAVVLTAGSNIAALYKDLTFGAWTNVLAKNCDFNITYEAATN